MVLWNAEPLKTQLLLRDSKENGAAPNKEKVIFLNMVERHNKLPQMYFAQSVVMPCTINSLIEIIYKNTFYSGGLKTIFHPELFVGVTGKFKKCDTLTFNDKEVTLLFDHKQ